MPQYETLCVLRPELPEARIKELTAWMQKIIEDAHGTVTQIEEWGLRELAFQIRKQTRGYYVRLEYTAPAPVVKELERNLKLNEDVLRFLSVVRPASTAATPPQPHAVQSPPPMPANVTEPSAEEQ
ncbi:MAG: 30S ribosomal protein S6 [Candidatus Binatia bacterium]|nr:30S ribosomal protein S6 [Candidatus Binatia bacterium]